MSRVWSTICHKNSTFLLYTEAVPCRSKAASAKLTEVSPPSKVIVTCCKSSMYVENKFARGTSQFWVRSLMGFSNSANLWSSTSDWLAWDWLAILRTGITSETLKEVNQANI